MGILSLLQKHQTAALQLTEDEREKISAALKLADTRIGQEPDHQSLFREELAELEASSKQEPTEWVYHWALCFSYYHIKQYDKALRSGEKAFMLRPNDARSCYALAMTLYALTWARHFQVPDQEQEQLTLGKFRAIGQPTEEYDAQASWTALEVLGISIKTAAERAIVLFARLAHLAKSDEIENIAEINMESLAVAFPNLRSLAQAASNLYLQRPLKTNPKLEELTPGESKKVANILESNLAVPIPADHERDYVEEIITELEMAAAKEPAEWIYLWMLIDYCLAAKKYGKAYNISQRALELAPNDPRSSYGMATVLDRLASAGAQESEERRRFWTASKKPSPDSTTHPTTHSVIDTTLRALGMTIDEAAQFAVVLFVKTIQFGLSEDDRRMVQNRIDSLTHLFPHLQTDLPKTARTTTLVGTYFSATPIPRDTWSFWSAYKWSLYGWLTVMMIGLIENIRSQAISELVIGFLISLVAAVLLALPVALVLWTMARVIARRRYN